MSVLQRFCQVAGHDQYVSTHLCTFRDCNQYSRWACTECSFKKLHLHGQLQNNHIMNFQKFKSFILQNNFDDLRLEKLEIQQYLQEIDKIIKSAEQLQKQELKRLLGEIDIWKMKNISEKDFYLMDSEFINKTLKYKDTEEMKKVAERVQENILNISNLFQALKISTLKKQQQQIKNQVGGLNNYFTEVQQNQQISSASISNNKQYLAYGGFDKIQTIYDIKKKTIVQSLKFDSIINVCQFSKDSKLLYIGCHEGHIHCLDNEDNFKLIYSEQLYTGNVNTIIEQSNALILSCSQQDIITDLKQKTQILKIENVHNSQIFVIDYNQINDFIGSGSCDQSIKIYNGKTGQVLIEKFEAHSSAIEKIQMINENRLLSLDFNHFLKLWQINLENNDLVLINYLQDIDKIVNFRQLEDKSIVLISQQFIKIIDEDFNQTQCQKQPQVNHIVISEINQLGSHYYVVIPPKNQITIIKLQQDR